MVQLREAADAPSPFHGMPGVGPSDQEAVKEDWQGLPVATPEGAVGLVAVGGEGYGGCFRVSGGHEGGVQGVGWEGKGG